MKRNAIVNTSARSRVRVTRLTSRQVTKLRRRARSRAEKLGATSNERCERFNGASLRTSNCVQDPISIPRSFISSRFPFSASSNGLINSRNRVPALLLSRLHSHTTTKAILVLPMPSHRRIFPELEDTEAPKEMAVNRRWCCVTCESEDLGHCRSD